jgi:4-hydroxy-tetrahydrodipicolinate reductase
MGDAMKIGILGCTGRVGKTLVSRLVNGGRHKFIGGTASSANAKLGFDIGEALGIGTLGIALTDDPTIVFENADLVIDFTNAQALEHHLPLAETKKVPCVVGITGLEDGHRRTLERVSKTIPLVYAPNMSFGINLLLAYVEKAARLFGEDYDIEILEMHHRHKADAPSGTALAAGKAAARGRGRSFGDIACVTHKGRRRQGDIGFAVMRGGEIMGDLQVMFVSEGESFSLSHRTFNREVYADGALKAAEWLYQQKAGLYDMQDVLGLKTATS